MQTCCWSWKVLGRKKGSQHISNTHWDTAENIKRKGREQPRLPHAIACRHDTLEKIGNSPLLLKLFNERYRVAGWEDKLLICLNIYLLLLYHHQVEGAGDEACNVTIPRRQIFFSVVLCGRSFARPCLISPMANCHTVKPMNCVRHTQRTFVDE